jgi:hypothetical protein
MAMCPPRASAPVRTQNEVPGEGVPYAHHAHPIEQRRLRPVGPTRYQRTAVMDSPTVVRLGVDALLKGRPSLVPGRLNAASAWANRLLPRRASAALAHRLMV